MLELEGTWEEIAARASEFAGRRVRLTVLSEAENGAKPANTDLTAWLDELDADDQMPMTPAEPSGTTLVREGRAGPIYGYEPGE